MLEAAKQPFRSVTWTAALAVVLVRDGGDLALTRRRGVTRRGKSRPCLRIVRRIFSALTDPAGVLAHRRAAFERVAWVLADWDIARGP